MAYVGFAGGIYCLTGINSHGIFISSDAGWLSDPRTSSGAPQCGHFDVLLNSRPTDAENYFFDPAHFPHRATVTAIADASETRVLERAIDAVKVRTGSGMIVATNHFVDSSWGLASPPAGAAGWWTLQRYENLTWLAGNYSGTIDATRMRSIFDIPLSQGGATMTPVAVNQMSTIYQVVAVPAQLAIWVKTPGNSDWQLVDLSTLFQQ